MEEIKVGKSFTTSSPPDEVVVAVSVAVEPLRGVVDTGVGGVLGGVLLLADIVLYKVFVYEIFIHI